MASTEVNIPSSDGQSLPAYVALPDAGTGPAVVMIVTIRGVNADMKAYADELAAEGFCVAVPDPFWRDEDPGVLEGAPDSHDRALARLKRVDYQTALRDIASVFNFLKRLPQCDGKTAMVGFCFGGTIAFLAAARLKIGAGVAFHSGKLLHVLNELEHVTCPLSFHWGDNDVIFPMADIEQVQQAFAGHEGAEVLVHPGAAHGFMEPSNTGAYDETAARSAWHRAIEVLRGA